MLISKKNGDDLTEQTHQLDSYLTPDSVRKKITALQQSTDEIALETPDELNWQKINHRLAASTHRTRGQGKSTNIFTEKKPLLAMVASLSFLFIGGLSWYNYQLQQQLVMALKTNQSMELQLAEYSQLQVNQYYLLQEISAVEAKLLNEPSLKVKVAILKHRSALMQQVLEYQQGGNDEFSI
jgi:hypothetical protein